MAIAKVRDILRMLRRDGWWLELQQGSHRQFRHASKRGTVTVNGHEGETIPEWLVGAILRQAGLTKEDLKEVMQYLVVIEPAEEGSGYGAYVPDLPGCVAVGKTPEEVKERTAFSLPLHIQSFVPTAKQSRHLPPKPNMSRLQVDLQSPR
jgi:predicted RNA binding protein YcfA (HicA-like mRNA interferase family)/predicted RNase H-like HicB family nuclease